MKLSEMQRVLSNRFQSKIKKLANPLIDHFGLTEFYHYRQSNTGQYVNLGLNAACEEFFYGNIDCSAKTPFLRNTKHLKSGVTFIRAIPDDEFDTVLEALRDKFKVNWCLQLMTKTPTGIEAYGFGLNSDDLRQHLSFYNSLPILNHFIEKFKEEMAPYRDVLDENQVDLATLLGQRYDQKPPELVLESRPYEGLLKELGLKPSTPLTIRELDVIKHLLNGCSASLIAKELMLSSRTVEHYIENIKEKFDCTTKSDLVKTLRCLDSMNYFNQ